MSVVVLIKRTVPQDKVKQVLPLFRELRRRALDRPGYVSGATLHRIDKPGEYLVISTWQLLEDWTEWLASKERNEIQSVIDALLGPQTNYEIYHYRLPE
jgi:heme-degrading monooxygenase HmoA